MTTPAIPGYTRRKMLADIEAHAPASPDDTTLFAPDAVAQATGMFGMGLHILFNELMPLQLEALIPFCARNRVAWVVIMGEAGGQFTQCLDYVQRFRVGAPDTNVIVRMWPDDGHLKKHGLNPVSAYQQIAPYKARMIGMGVWWLLDNESNEHDLRGFSECTAAVLELAGKDGLGVAWGGFATGVPDDGHELRDAYGLGKPRGEGELDAMLLAGSKWRHLHILSINEYFGLTAALSAGHVGRYKRYLTRYAELGVPAPRIMIREYGMIGNYHDADSGFRRYKSAHEFFSMARHWFETVYQPDDVAVDFFAVCSQTKRWRDFDVQGEVMALMGAYAQSGKGNIEMALPQPNPLPSANDPRWVQAVLASPQGASNLRATASTSGTVLVAGGVPDGATVHYIVPEPAITGGNYTWLYVKYQDTIGYMALVRGQIGQQFKAIVPPVPAPPPLPQPEASVWTPRKLTVSEKLRDAPFLKAGKHTDSNGNVYDHEAGAVIQSLNVGAVLAVYLDILYEADDHQWIGVKVEVAGITHIGWMAVVGSVGQMFVALDPVPPVDPPPVEEVPDDTQKQKMLKEALVNIREGLDQFSQGLQVVILMLEEDDQDTQTLTETLTKLLKTSKDAA